MVLFNKFGVIKFGKTDSHKIVVALLCEYRLINSLRSVAETNEY
jgi:hypothetical protein